MGFLGAQLGSQGFKNMNKVLKFQRKVEQCGTFEEKEKNIQFEFIK